MVNGSFGRASNRKVHPLLFLPSAMRCILFNMSRRRPAHLVASGKNGPATRLSRHEDSEGFARNGVPGVPCLCVHGKDDKAGTAHQPAGRRLFDPHRVCRGSRAPSMNSACTTCVRVLRPTAKTAIDPIDPKFWERKYREA